MCLTPVRIRNRSRRYRPFFDKPFLDVPCGKCEECISKSADDWFVRGSAEFMRVKDKGFVLFPTLTFRNEDLPVWKDDDLNFQCPVFNHDCFVSFRNKLRVYLKREGFDFTGDNTIRFFYASEYGSKFGRSHLHCLLFVPKYIDIGLFKRLVKKAWIYGIVGYSKNGDTLQSVKAVKYVMKYIAKDSIYYNKYGIDEYIERLKDIIENSSDLHLKAYTKKKLAKFRSMLPCHRQSMGFGSSIALNDVDFINGTIASDRLGLYDGKRFNYSIPAYYLRKRLYDFDKETGIYTINSFGMEVKRKQFIKNVENIEKKLNLYFYDDFFNDYIQQFKDNFGYNSFCFVRDNCDLHDVAVFNFVYRGVALKPLQIDLFNNMKNEEFLRKMDDESYYFYCSSIDNRRVPVIDDYRNNGASAYIGFNDVSVYRAFSVALDFLDNVLSVYNSASNIAKKENRYKQFIQFKPL